MQVAMLGYNPMLGPASQWSGAMNLVVGWIWSTDARKLW